MGCSAIEGCTKEQIQEAQDALDILFPDEYIDYVKKFGCIDFGSTEWTGLNIKGRLNTVTATKQEMDVNAFFPKGCFVLENLGIDAKRVIVNEKGRFIFFNMIKKRIFAGVLRNILICA